MTDSSDSGSQKSSQAVQGWLALTREDELDCDQFAELLAPWLDQRVTDPRLLELLEHHSRLCAECEEEAHLLRTALAADD